VTYGSYDNAIPDEVRLSLYLSTRYLQELELALTLLGVPCTYVRPGLGCYALPRLYVGFTDDAPEALRKAENFICALPFVLNSQWLSWNGLDPEWWFAWSGDPTTPICQATNMQQAARVIADQLFEESA
jgi:hypothetical protein